MNEFEGGCDGGAVGGDCGELGGEGGEGMGFAQWGEGGGGAVGVRDEAGLRCC